MLVTSVQLAVRLDISRSQLTWAIDDTGNPFDLTQALWREISNQIDKGLRHQPLRAANQKWRWIGRLVQLYPLARGVERAHHVGSRTEDTGDMSCCRLAGQVSPVCHRCLARCGS